MKSVFLLMGALLCAVGILLMLAQRIHEWRQRRARSDRLHGGIASRMPHWLGNVGLALIALGALLACVPLL